MMERYPIREWRRKKTKQKWQSRVHNAYFYFGYNSSSNLRGIKEYESWKELLKVKWFKGYKTLARRCYHSCCQDEKYKRQDFCRESERIIKEELFD